MCNLYRMTANVDEMRRLFGPFDGDRDNLPLFDEIYPNYRAPVLRRNGSGGLKLEMMTWGFPGPQASGGRPVTNVRNLTSPFWRSALKDPAPMGATRSGTGTLPPRPQVRVMSAMGG